MSRTTVPPATTWKGPAASQAEVADLVVELVEVTDLEAGSEEETHCAEAHELDDVADLEGYWGEHTVQERIMWDTL